MTTPILHRSSNGLDEHTRAQLERIRAVAEDYMDYAVKPLLAQDAVLDRELSTVLFAQLKKLHELMQEATEAIAQGADREEASREFKSELRETSHAIGYGASYQFRNHPLTAVMHDAINTMYTVVMRSEFIYAFLGDLFRDLNELPQHGIFDSEMASVLHESIRDTFTFATSTTLPVFPWNHCEHLLNRKYRSDLPPYFEAMTAQAAMVVVPLAVDAWRKIGEPIHPTILAAIAADDTLAATLYAEGYRSPEFIDAIAQRGGPVATYILLSDQLLEVMMEPSGAPSRLTDESIAALVSRYEELCGTVIGSRDDVMETVSAIYQDRSVGLSERFFSPDRYSNVLAAQLNLIIAGANLDISISGRTLGLGPTR